MPQRLRQGMLLMKGAAMQAALLFLWAVEIAGLVLTFEEFGLKITNVCLMGTSVYLLSSQDCLIWKLGTAWHWSNSHSSSCTKHALLLYN